MSDQRPLPRPSRLSRPFWDAARQHRLLRPYCATCQRSFFPPQLCCPTCLSQEWEWVASHGRGTVYSHTTVNRAPLSGFEVPYVLAVVDLEDGFSLMTNIVDVRPERVAIGMAVRVGWQDVDTVTLPVFHPAGN